MDKIVWGILGFAIVAVFTVQSAAAENELYLVPMQSTATYSNTADVEIWVKAAEFQGGQINLTYDSSCANVTDWERNTTNFLIGGWSHYDGREWITFSTMDPQSVSLTGNYMIGTLTIHCVSEEGCETPLAFIEPSKLLDDRGDQVPTTRKEGTFRCLALTPAQASAVTPKPSSGDASVTHTTTPTPTATPNLTPRQTLTPIATASPLVTSAPTTSPEGERELPGFEAVFAILGLLGISYLISKRGGKSD